MTFRLSIERRILLGLSVLLLGFAGSMGHSYFVASRSEQRLRTAADFSYPVSLNARDAVFTFAKAAKAYSDAGILGDEEALKDAIAQSNLTILTLQKIDNLARQEPALRVKIKTATDAVAAHGMEAKAVFALIQKSAEPSILQARAATLATLTEKANEQLATLSDGLRAELEGTLKLVAEDSRSQRTASVGLFLLIAALSTGVVLLIIRRSIVTPVNAVVDGLQTAVSRVNEANHVLSTSSNDLSNRASTQAASLEETSAAIEEINAMATRNTSHVQDVRSLSREALTTTEAGVTSVGEMQTTLKQVNGAVEQMKRAMEEVQGSSTAISKIIKTIDEIAFQTNILAINAAVEAARAGAAGTGFAVVATEVRALAQRSAEAARETAVLIENSLVKSRNGAAASGNVYSGLRLVLDEALKVEQNLARISGKVRDVDRLVDEVATASKEQTDGIRGISNTLTELDRNTQANAATAQETATTVSQLNTLTDDLTGQIDSLVLLVRGAVASTASRPPKVESAVPTAPETTATAPIERVHADTE